VFGLLKSGTHAKGRIGLTFNGGQVAVAVISHQSGPVALERCELLPVDAAGGAEAIRAALRAAGLPRLPVSIVLRPADYQLALVEAPEVPPAELRAAMRWRLKDAIDFPVEDAVIDVFDLPAQNRSRQGRMVYAVAARRSAVAGYSAALAAVPTFDVIDVPELCLRNLASALPEARGGVALLHLGETAATVVLIRGTTFYLARQMSLSAAHRSAAGGDAGPSLDSAAVVLELQRSLDYYERHFDQPPITRIAISPGGPHAQVLATDLSRDTGLDVTVLDLNSVLSCTQPLDPAIQEACVMAVGAALREERRTL
jgi:MSHA biogenesis protein MshI